MATTEMIHTYNLTNSTEEFDGDMKPNILYMVCEIIVAVFAVIGNALVILVFYQERRLRRRTNYYIVSLAIADLLVGLLGIPFAILASMGLPRNLYACLFTVSLLVVLCTISIFCLVAVSVDRYWAILHPMGYSRNVRTKTAIAIIVVCWVSGTLVGFLPLFGWHKSESDMEVRCLFTKVMDYDYLVFLYFATIIIPALVLAAFYAHIYRVVLKQLRQIVTMNPTGGGTMLRMLGAAQKREVKATQNLSIIVLFFIICWIPLYTINCVQAFCTNCDIPLALTNFCIILSHVNSAMNPLLYAYHLRDFRDALKNLLCGLFFNNGEGEGNDVQAGRFGSHNTLQRHGVNTPIRNNSLQSLHHMRVQQSYVESPTVTTKTTSNSIVANSPLSTIISNMNTIHQSVTDLPLSGDNQHRRKRMWTLTEVPSVSEDDGSVIPTGNGHLTTEQSRTSGQVNSAFIADRIVLDYSEDDDEVFVSTTEVNKADDQESTREDGNTRSSRHESEEVEFIKTASLTSDSRKSLQSNSLETADFDNSNTTLDEHDKTELSPRNKECIIVRSDARNCNGTGVPTLGPEIAITSSECDEGKNVSSTASGNSRLSPLKIVGEFLFNTTIAKCNLLHEDVSDESCELKSNNCEPRDFHEANIAVQRKGSADSVHESNCATSKIVVSKKEDNLAT